MLTPPEFDSNLAGLEELESLVAMAEGLAADASEDTDSFYEALRRSDIPFLLDSYEDDPGGMILASLTALHALGSASPALALGISQHLATMLAIGLGKELLSPHEVAGPVMTALLEEVRAGRLLVANTTSQSGDNRIGARVSKIVPWGDGFRIDGHSTYMSLATKAQKIVFLTSDPDGGLVGVVADATDHRLVVSDELLFGNHLRLADTRKVTFDGLEVDASSVFGPDPGLDAYYLLQLICQTLCVSALYLGGAARIADEVTKHARGSSLPAGGTLAESESFAANFGCLAITYLNSADLLLAQVGPLVELIANRRFTTADMSATFLRTSAAKHGIARGIETVAVEGRKLIGARAFMGNHPVARVGSEVVFAALGPATEKLIERNVGTTYLRDMK